MARAARCGYVVNAGEIPRHRGVTIPQAISEGEDYELLVAMDPERAAPLMRAWLRRFPRLRLTAIGHLARPGGVWLGARGVAPGWDHFARDP